MKLIPGICLQSFRQRDSQIFSSQEKKKKKAVRKYGKGMINHMESIHSLFKCFIYQKKAHNSITSIHRICLSFFRYSINASFLSEGLRFKCQTW